MALPGDSSRAPLLRPFAAAVRLASRTFPKGRRRTAAIAAAIATTVALVLLLSAGPIARSIATSRAEAMGIRLVVRETGIGWGSVRLAGVTVSSPELPDLKAELARIDVLLGFTGARRVTVHGGSVVLRGAREHLEKEVRAFRAAHARGGSAKEHGSVLPLSVDGIDVTWTVDERALTAQHVWGARYERDADGAQRVGVDLARATVGSASIEVSKGAAALARDGEARVLTSVAAERVAVGVDVGAEAHEPGATRDDRLRPSSVRTGPSEEAPSAWNRLRTELDRAASAAAKALRPSTRFELPDVRFELRHEGQVLNVGPAKAVLERDAMSVKASVTSGEGERATPIRFDIAVPLGEGPVDVGLTGGPVSLAALGVKEHDMGLESVDRSEVEASGRARLDGEAVHLSGRVRLSDVSVLERKLSNEVVRGLRLGISGDADISLDASHTRFTNVELEVGKVKLLATGSLERSEGHARGALHLEVPLAACSDMLASVPSGLVPLLAGLEMTGAFAFSGDLSFDSRRPKDTRVTWDVGNGCKISRVPASLSIERFARPWVRTVVGAGGIPATLESGPGTPTWVPLYDISPHLATAVVVCEDANFWTHGGFNQKSIQDSIRDDLKAGKFVRGGSTVTMQLAKNLYLRREKTVSRKLQEAVLTVLLEQSLTKEQILELYLNVIEFAPGVYGIGPAAAHYFHSRPRDLSLAQSLYLISVLPNPKVHHFKKDGSLSDGWTEYLRHLMEVAHKIRKIDDRELATALAEEVHRGVAANEATDDGAGSGLQDDLTPPDRDPEGP
jgi:hypothetical protein